MSERRITLWRVDAANTPDSAVNRFEGMLGEEELQRLAALAGTQARRFTIFRGALRVVLGRRCGCEPSSLRFDYGPRGKPRLASPVCEARFNLSHSGDHAIVAICVDAEIGVDIEAIDEHVEHLAVSRQVFSRNEQLELEAMPIALRARAFYDGWTRREAVLKALGSGIARPVESFDVPLAGNARLTRVEMRDGADAGSAMTLIPLYLGDDLAGALALADPCDDFDLEMREFRAESP